MASGENEKEQRPQERIVMLERSAVWVEAGRG